RAAPPEPSSMQAFERKLKIYATSLAVGPTTPMTAQEGGVCHVTVFARQVGSLPARTTAGGSNRTTQRPVRPRMVGLARTAATRGSERSIERGRGGCGVEPTREGTVLSDRTQVGYRDRCDTRCRIRSRLHRRTRPGNGPFDVAQHRRSSDCDVEAIRRRDAMTFVISGPRFGGEEEEVKVEVGFDSAFA